MSDIETIVSDLKNAHWEAMDEITRLRADNERLREALKPFANRINLLEECKGAAKYGIATDISLEYLRRARAALEGVKEKEGAGNE